MTGTSCGANLTFVKSLRAEKAVDYAKGPLEGYGRRETLEELYGLVKKGSVFVTKPARFQKKKQTKMA